MSFVMFATWLLVGALVGVLAGLVMKHGARGLKTDVFLGLAGSIGGSWIFRGLFYSGGGMLMGVVVAGIGALMPIIAQRLVWPTERLGQNKGAIWKWGVGVALVAAMFWMNVGPAKPPVAAAAVIEDKSYTVTPPSLRVKAGVVAGEVVDMRITERAERRSDRVVSLAKLTGILRLKNTSTNQTVHLITGKLQYVDGQGQPIKLEGGRAEPTVKFASANSDRLDPGQETTEAMDVDVPTEALTAGTLKEIRLELAYITSPYRAETVRLPVTIGRQ